MLTSNSWTYVGLQNDAKGAVIDFVYKNAEGPRSGKMAKASVVQFCDLDSEVVTVLPGVP